MQNNENTNKNVISISLKKALEENYDLYDSYVLSLVNNLKEENKTIKEIVEKLGKEYSKVEVYEKFVATRFGNELESFASISSDKIIKTIESITDTGIQRILKNHLDSYKELVDDKVKYDTEKAFSPDGILEMNNNIVNLNNGKFHHPIYKVRTADAMGTKFSVSEYGQKSTKYVVTAAGSNAFCGFYQNGTDRKFYIPTLRESVQNLKDGFEPCPVTHPDDTDFKLIFVLNPNDLVYVPTEEEKENPNLIDFSKMKKEQLNRVYKFTDGSGTTMNFVPSNVSSLLFNMSNKEQEKTQIKLSIQNELGLGSPQSKNQNSLDGIQIKSVCIKLKVDRLGNISKA